MKNADEAAGLNALTSKRFNLKIQKDLLYFLELKIKLHAL